MVAWNVRGMCNRDMQKEFRKFISDEKLNICAALETHIKERKINKIYDFVYGNWSWVSNMNKSDRGCKIIVGWKEEDVNLMLIHSTKQTMLCLNEIKDSKNKFFYCFVYAANTGKERRILYKDLKNYRRMIDDKPWVLMGDWNVSLHLEEHSEGGSCKTSDMIDFQECLEKIEVEDLNCSGIHFTWVHSRQDPSSGILKKIDRVLGNTEFVSRFINSHALVLPHLTSDHSPALLIIPKMKNKKHKAFRFSNFIADKPEFICARALEY
ncbi:RNA-directed DNA polymerase, eukaryota, reverse transcriptase zinc-binding domain protein [Tanacetum coccineum]